MGLKGYTFDRMKISPKADALLYHSMLDGNDRIVNGYKDELKVVATGLNTYISPGACVVQGRMIEIDEEMQLSVSANDSGYVCIVIDLTQNNTSTGEVGTPDYQPVNNQLRLEVVKELVQQDLHDGGQLYTFPLASFTSTGTTVALTKINHNQLLNKEISAERTIDASKVANGKAQYEYIDFGAFYIVTINVSFNSATTANSTGVWIENFVPANLRPKKTLLFDMTSITQQRNRFKVAVTAGSGQLNCYDSSIPINSTPLEYVGIITYMVVRE